MTNPSNPGGLQFDKVSSAAAPTGMTCANCGKAIGDTYYTVRDKPICEECKQKADVAIGARFARGRSSAAFGKAVVFGVGAAIGASILYYLFAIVMKAEWALVTIAMAWAIGRAIQIAAGGVGGRRYQVLAALLTYFSIGLAQGFVDLHNDPGAGASAVVFSTLFGPITSVVGQLMSAGGSNPLGGAISALIYGFGIRTAWRMTAGAVSLIKGPFRVGAAPAAAPR